MSGTIDPRPRRRRRAEASEHAPPDVTELAERYGCGPVRLTGEPSSLYERHLTFDDVVPLEEAGPRERYEAFARSVRDVLSQRWIRTEETYRRRNAKRVYYLSMEFLIGRSLGNNLLNLQIDEAIAARAGGAGVDLHAILEVEPDAGLGNGGLGRLAACFLDSMATLALPAMGYGLRYEYGIFRQSFRDGWQHEKPDHWLARVDPWEVPRHDECVEVRLGCSFEMRQGCLELVPGLPSTLVGVPHDRPIVGWGGRTVNTLRLWAAHAPEEFDFEPFSRGEFVEALADGLTGETLTRVLYPDDSTERGKALRLLQEYFLVACSLADLVRRFRRTNADWHALPDHAAVQLNDTHPALAVPELLRILLDEAHLDWDAAWDLTRRTLAYTNHTLLPEALETWPLEWFERMLPRHLELIHEINRRLLEEVRYRHPGDEGRVARVSLIDEGFGRRLRMAHLAVVGSHSTNGVAAIHSRLLRETTLRDLAAVFPERFNNKTNGVTPRRWLLLANPALSRVITDAIGDAWIADLGQLTRLRELADDGSLRADFLAAKRAAKARLSDWLRAQGLPAIDPDTLVDCQIKRIHEYKRQFLNALRIVALYDRMRRDRTEAAGPPRTFIFSGKAAPAYRAAKLIVKFINNLAGTIDGDPDVGGRLRVLYVPEYNVSLAERLIPAADVSNQISTAGYEASGTSNMKFMMNGALTLGTRDGATIELAEEAGEEHLFLFGLTAAEVSGSEGWYNPRWHLEHEPEVRSAFEFAFSGHFSRNEPGVFEPLRRMLVEEGDRFRHLADLRPYLRADALLVDLHRRPSDWAGEALINVAASGRFSSDRTIAEYARDIWDVQPCPVP